MSTCTVPPKEKEANDDAVPTWDELVAIGSIATSQGREGEVAVNPLTDHPERFVDLSRVFLEGEDGAPVPRIVESARLHKGRLAVKLTGVSNIGDARALSGKEMRIPASELVSLPDGSFYHFQILGLNVIDSAHRALGIAESFIATGGTDVLVVRSPEGEELLLPFCSEICRRIDLDEGTIEVEAPEGLLDLNAN